MKIFHARKNRRKKLQLEKEQDKPQCNGERKPTRKEQGFGERRVYVLEAQMSQWNPLLSMLTSKITLKMIGWFMSQVSNRERILAPAGFIHHCTRG